MSLHFLPGIDLKLLKPQTVLAIAVANDAFTEAGEDCLVTSVCRQGAFLEVGYHGAGEAVDIAVRRLDGTMIEDGVMNIIIRKLQSRIGRPGGGQYDVVDERPDHSPSSRSTGPHIHIEYDPK
jgi:hypothetical protein